MGLDWCLLAGVMLLDLVSAQPVQEGLSIEQ
jgi:hypothetical protein